MYRETVGKRFEYPRKSAMSALLCQTELGLGELLFHNNVGHRSTQLTQPCAGDGGTLQLEPS